MSGRRMLLNRWVVLGTVVAFFFLTSAVVANGVQENRVAQAKVLIAQKNYNDALLILVKVVSEEPDRQDEAQELINEIMRLRNQYNSDYEKVINLLYVQENVEEALKVINSLEALDTNPNKQTIEEIKQAKRTARLKANNKRYNDIMARALAALNRGEYGAAIQVYLEGEDLAKDMFLEAGFGNLLNDQVDRAWTDMKAAARLVVQAEGTLKTLPNQGLAILASATTAADLEPVLAPLRDLASWRQRIWADGALYQNQNQFLVKNGRQEDFFLSYSYLFVHGPPGSPQREGILGAIDRLWTLALDPWTARVRTEVEAQYQTAKAAFDQGRYPEAKVAFDQLKNRASQGLEIVTLWNRTSGIDATGSLDAWYRTQLNQVLPLGLWLERRMVLGGQGARASEDIPRAASLVARANLDRSGLESARADVRTQKSSFGQFANRASGWTRQTEVLQAEGFSLPDPVALTTGWQTVWGGLQQRALAQEATLVDRRGLWDYGLLDGRFQQLQTALTAARTQVEGAVKFPLQASAKLTELRPAQDTLAQDVKAFVDLYEGEAADVKTPAVLAWPGRGKDLAGRLAAAQTLQGQLLATAQANYAQSQALKRQGQDLVAQVNASTAAENFTKAKADLNTISSRFADSLRFQEDPAFRAESDALVRALGEQILAAENVVVVREVRQYINQGSEAFLAQQFRQSEQILLRAQKRWSDTNRDPNSEVEYWLNLTSNALSVTTGRELSPIDPLYNEVQQLLNFARRNYNLGKEKIDAGAKEEGLALMAEASTILGKILLTAPQNQEAGLLRLEVLQSSDPENFPARYKQNFDAAVAKIGTENQAAYSDLQDLDKIQPNYPGMAAALKRVRVALGLEKSAEDAQAQAAALAEARTLVAQANRLFQGGTPAQLTEALRLVRQALQRDPKNTAAQNLADQINIRISVRVATLTPSQVGELNDMLDLLRNQRTLEALARINDFKAKNPAVANDDRVREVERRIKAVN